MCCPRYEVGGIKSRTMLKFLNPLFAILFRNRRKREKNGESQDAEHDEPLVFQDGWRGSEHKMKNALPYIHIPSTLKGYGRKVC